MRALAVLLACVLASGCSVRLYGNQSTGGTATTTTASQVSGSAKVSGGKLSFSSGQVPTAGATGGHVKLSGSAAAVLLVGVVIADAVHYLGARFGARAQPAAPGESIADTCSCYRKDSDEIQVTR